MRLPLTPQLSTKDGVSDNNARLTNVLSEQDEQGMLAVVRPGLNKLTETTGSGKGIVSFNDELVSVYGSNMNEIVDEWFLSAVRPSANIAAVAKSYANGYFFAFEFFSGLLWKSLDGITWESVNTGYSNNYISDVVYDGSNYRFLGLRTADYKVWAYTSSDLVSFTRTDTGVVSNNISLRLAFNGTRYVSNAHPNADKRTVISSTDFVSWSTTVVFATEITEGGLVYGGGKFVLVSAEATDSVYSSTDGITWTEAFLPDVVNSYCIVYAKGRFVTVNTLGSIAQTSPDGLTWESNPTGFTVIGYALSYNNVGFLFGGSSVGSSSLIGSSDGVNWYEVSTPLSLGSAGFAATNGNTIVIGELYKEYSTVTDGGNRLSPIAAITGDFFDFAQSIL